MNAGTTFKQCGCRDKAPASRSGANARNCGAATAGALCTAPGTTSSNSRRAPTGPAAPRCATAASLPRPAPRPNSAWPVNCWPSPPPGDPGTAIRIADAITATFKDTGTLPDPDRVRKQIGGGHDPAVRPPTAGEWLEEWLAAKKKLRPGTVRSYAGHIRLYLKPHLGHISVDRLRVTDVASVFDQIDELNDAITAGPRQRRSRPARSCQGTAADRPGHLPADPRHPALGDQHLHETAPRRPARQRRLPRRAARRHPAQGRWSGPTNASAPGSDDFDARLAARAGPYGGRVSPARHLDLHPAPVPGHGLDPGPDHGLPRLPPAATGCTRCGG